jgi:tetratricopeptide (TPR) repeat protein
MSYDPVQLLRAARSAIQQQDYTAAIDAMQKLVTHDRETNNKALEVIHLGNLALLQNRLGLSDVALTNLERALELARAAGDRAAEDGVLGNMGNILRELGDYDGAERRLNAALVVAQEIGDTRGRGNWLSVLGLVYNDTGRHEEAMTCHTEAVSIARQLVDQKGLALRLGQLGNALLGAGRPQAALAPYQESLGLYRSLGDEAALAGQLGVIANLNADLGRTSNKAAQKEAYCFQALAHYREALKLAQGRGDTVAEAVQLRGMGAVYGNLGDYDEAVRRFREAAALFQQMNMIEQAAKLHESIQLAERLRSGDFPTT